MVTKRNTQQCDASSHHIVKMYCDSITSETHSFIVPNHIWLHQMPLMALFARHLMYIEGEITLIYKLSIV